MTKYKVLKFKEPLTIYAFGPYAHPMLIDDEVAEFGGSEMPSLMTEETTIAALQAMYPKLDFTEVELVTITLVEE